MKFIRNKSDLKFIIIGLILITLTFLYLVPKYREPNVYLIQDSSFSPYDIKYIGDQSRTSYTTVLTTLFHFVKSKHREDEYEKWFKNMLTSVDAALIAYVDEYWADEFVRQCRRHNRTAIVYITKTIWHVLREFELKRSKIYIPVYQTQQWRLDQENYRHSPELYAVWNLKHYMLEKSAELNPFGSEFFVYTDSGAWRERTLTTWPDERFVRQLVQKLDNRILYGQVVNSPENMDKFPDIDLIQGTFISGTKKAIAKASMNFYRLHDEWLERGRFVGKDQILMNVLAFHPNTKHNIVRVITADLDCSRPYDSWFFYQIYFASESEYFCKPDRLSLLLE